MRCRPRSTSTPIGIGTYAFRRNEINSFACEEESMTYDPICFSLGMIVATCILGKPTEIPPPEGQNHGRNQGMGVAYDPV